MFRNLSSLEGKMTKLQKGLSQVDHKVSNLKKTFEVRTTEAAKLKVELEKEQETIEAAENLVGKLEGEYQRWSEQVRLQGCTCVGMILDSENKSVLTCSLV